MLVVFRQVRLGFQALKIFGVQWLGFTIAALLKTEHFYDLFGTGTFIMVAFLSRQHSQTTPRPTLRCDVVTGLVCTWGLRLGIFLVHRIHKAGRDKRFDKVRENPVMFYVYWTLQGVWVTITTMPISVLSLRPENWDAASLLPNDKLGIAIFAVGFLCETVADFQKSAFRGDAANADEFIRTGLWKHCRHPNYFGEILVWVGITIVCQTPLTMQQRIMVVPSPIFVAFLLSQMSGVPILERAAWKKWGSREDYRKYVSTSRVLLLLPWAPKPRRVPVPTAKADAKED
jgi:steroid 5-alpha reductase family enzyme